MSVRPSGPAGLTLSGAAVPALLRALVAGDVVQVRVVEVLGPDRFLIEMMGQRVEAASGRALAPGQIHALRVQEVGRPVVLQWLEPGGSGGGAGTGTAAPGVAGTGTAGAGAAGTAEGAALSRLVSRSVQLLGPPPAGAGQAAAAPEAVSWAAFSRLLSDAQGWLDRVQGEALRVLQASEPFRTLRAWREALGEPARGARPEGGTGEADAAAAREAAREPPTPERVAALLRRGGDAASWRAAFDRLEAQAARVHPRLAPLRAIAAEWLAARDRWAHGAREALERSGVPGADWVAGFAGPEGGGEVRIRIEPDRSGRTPRGRPPGSLEIRAILSRLGEIRVGVEPREKALSLTFRARDPVSGEALWRDRRDLEGALLAQGWSPRIRLASWEVATDPDDAAPPAGGAVDVAG